MLKKLLIKNFRTHEDVALDFHPGVNVIWGIGGSGKTNLLRAIDWVVTNKPKYENVHSHFTNDPETSVTLVMDNGVAVLAKTPKKNEYVLDYKSSFSYTGATVPIPIAHLLNITEVNVNKQLDPHFLITSTPGDVGKTINRITKIEKIDEWISSLTTMSNKSKWSLDSTQEEIEVLEHELKHFDGIEELEQEIDLYQSIDLQINSIKEDIRYIKHTSSLLEQLQDRLDSIEIDITDIAHHMAEFDQLVKTCQDKKQTFVDVTRKVKQYRSLLSKKHNIEEIVSSINLDEIVDTITELKIRHEAMTQLNLYIRMYEQETYLNNRMDNLKSEYISAVKKLGTCPICQNTISPKHIKELEATL